MDVRLQRELYYYLVLEGTRVNCNYKQCKLHVIGSTHIVHCQYCERLSALISVSGVVMMTVIFGLSLVAAFLPLQRQTYPHLYYTFLPIMTLLNVPQCRVSFIMVQRNLDMRNICSFRYHKKTPLERRCRQNCFLYIIDTFIRYIQTNVQLLPTVQGIVPNYIHSLVNKMYCHDLHTRPFVNGIAAILKYLPLVACLAMILRTHSSSYFVADF